MPPVGNFARDIVEGEIAAEPPADAGDLKQHALICHQRMAGISPSGRQIATSTSSAPKNVMRQSCDHTQQFRQQSEDRGADDGAERRWPAPPSTT